MSNVIFNSGNYIKQLALGSSQNGLIYLNPQNRNITIGTSDGFVNFNELLVDYNDELKDIVDNYTNTSRYIEGEYIPKDRESRYYSVENAIDIIGNTSENNVDGYISKQLSTLINGIPYEGQTVSNIEFISAHSPRYYQNTCTIKFPNVIDKKFNIVIVFIYETVNINSSQSEIYTKIYPVVEQQDMEIVLRPKILQSFNPPSTINIMPYVYKAFWI